MSSTPRRCSACRRSATSTRASATRRRRCSRSASPRSKAAPPALAVASGHAAQVRRLPRADAAGRRVRRRAPALWRLDQPVQPLVQELRLEREVGRHRRHLVLREGGDAEDQGDLRRVDRQSRRRHHRHRGGRRGRQARRRAAHRRQHAGDALSLPAVRARRRHRRPFADQVPRRPRQLDRRHDRRRRQVQLARLQALPVPVGAAAGISRHGASARPSAISPSPSPAACSACAISARRSRRSTPS